MKIAVCEDETLFRDIEKRKLEAFFKEKDKALTVELFEDGLFLLSEIKAGKRFDCILMDLQMEQSDGMQIAAEIRKIDRTTSIIFVTGIETRAAEGYRVEALDYVSKANLDEGLQSALERFWQSYQASVCPMQTDEGETYLLTVSSILWFESDNRKTKIVTRNGEFITPLAIGKVAELLPADCFAELYKGVYAHCAAVKRVGHDTVEMENGKTLPLSRRKRTDVMEKIMMQMRGPKL